MSSSAARDRAGVVARLPGLAALTAAVVLLSGGSPAGARARRTAAAPVPLAGDWEGIGPHGLPLSFSLARRHRRLVATAIAVGYPAGCPASESDGYVIPLTHIAYAGPGGQYSTTSLFGPSSAASLSGHVPGISAGGWLLTGRFATRRSGKFTSTAPAKGPGCGWPRHWLNWRVHRAQRVTVADGRWSAQLSGSNITAGRLTATAAANGRVVTHLAASFHYACPGGGSGPESFEATWGEFVHPNGSFSSPQDQPITIDGVPVTWSARFSTAGELTGSFITAGPAACRTTPQATVRVSFTAGPAE